jgi:hypothetical protein
MLYKFVLISDEVENFVRKIEIDSEKTFFDLQKAILEAVKYSKEELTTFYICSEFWEKEIEVLPFDTGSDTSFTTYLMNETKLDELIENEGQKLLFVFDMLNERSFFIELKEIITGKTLTKPICTLKRGNPPVQLIESDDFFEKINKNSKSNIFDDDNYDDEGYNEDELDADGYSDFDFSEN